MGGADSDLFLYFKTLLLKGLIAARKHHDRIMTIIEIMYKGSILYFKFSIFYLGSSLPCFRGGLAAIKAMNDRFHMTYTDGQLHNLVSYLDNFVEPFQTETMVAQSLDSLTTRLYDNFQYYTNGIL